MILALTVILSMQEDELSFKEGDRLVVVGESEDDGW
jgi:hypothetical protein